ncbi:uncharacterized protein J7T54_008423 [Emericellopsis cladophorae]|uniref:Uncharacterized protein n=1 Tax=Emericellopsis cladophorae TaxID=2686198 RepID=A0A9P9Y2K8_9HYPO|nr:uncharacterized protein J7T54_008423 [Emericellopsis cladophorae]KAI6782337.1 hypothetical protein J7T54_008423 [Emericellopsis cladophorae]
MSSHQEHEGGALTLDFVTVDVFTTQRYRGNPLAVVLVPAALSERLPKEAKQRIAREFNLSETVFLHVPDSASTRRMSVDGQKAPCRADIFTTETELPFAGHPSIGTAHLIMNHLRWDTNALQLKAGIFPIRRLPGSHAQSGSPDPVQITVAHDLHIHSRTLADVLQCQVEHLDSPSLQKAHDAIVASLSLDEIIREAELKAPAVSIVKGMTALLVKLPSLEHLSRVSTASRLDFDEAVQGLLLDKGPWGSSFCYRYYYVPKDGRDGEAKGDGRNVDKDRKSVEHIRARMVELASEDPATGSAAVTLGAYLAMQEQAGRDMTRFEITQGVEMGRKSDIVVEVKSKLENGLANIEKVSLGGSAVIAMTGTVQL